MKEVKAMKAALRYSGQLSQLSGFSLIEALKSFQKACSSFIEDRLIESRSTGLESFICK